jgi:hypothetical protein
MNSKAFSEEVIVLPSGDLASADDCVFDAPLGFSSKPSLSNIYGHELSELFHGDLGIPNASSAEVFDYLQQLRSGPSSIMSHVVGVYVYLQDHFGSE